MAFSPLRAPRPVAHEDHGFFGPDSVTWKVWSYPTSVTVGFQRAVVIEELDPALVASVDGTQAIYDRPRTRYDRTLKYFALVAFGSSRETSRAADILVKVHSKAIGTDPVTGCRYDANDPESQLWIQLTAWHSILYAYERYGPGRLTAEEEERYWAECAVAAELQTCSPEDIPRTRAGVEEYFERMRPKLLASDLARRAMDHLLHAEVMLPGTWRVLTPVLRIGTTTLRVATVATMPRWMRELSGIRQPRVLDVLVRPVMRLVFAALSLSPRAQLAALRVLSPMTVPVVAPILLGVPPERAEVLTPAQARERYGLARPAEAHRQLRERQAARVFGEGAPPSEEGIVESEPVLGPIS